MRNGGVGCISATANVTLISTGTLQIRNGAVYTDSTGETRVGNLAVDAASTWADGSGTLRFNAGGARTWSEGTGAQNFGRVVVDSASTVTTSSKLVMGTLDVNGQEVKGVYRLIRQKLSPDEEIPAGMAAYRLKGTVYLLGVS